MLDLAWSEIALIAVVALVVIGPKDLPEAVRGVARGIQKLRRMAGEFRSQADELVREANLDELRQQIHDIRTFNVRDEFEKTVDKDGSLRRSFDDPLRDTYTPPPPPPPPLPGRRSGAAGRERRSRTESRPRRRPARRAGRAGCAARHSGRGFDPSGLQVSTMRRLRTARGARAPRPRCGCS